MQKDPRVSNSKHVQCTACWCTDTSANIVSIAHKPISSSSCNLSRFLLQIRCNYICVEAPGPVSAASKCDSSSATKDTPALNTEHRTVVWTGTHTHSGNGPVKRKIHLQLRRCAKSFYNCPVAAILLVPIWHSELVIHLLILFQQHSYLEDPF